MRCVGILLFVEHGTFSIGFIFLKVNDTLTLTAAIGSAQVIVIILGPVVLDEKSIYPTSQHSTNVTRHDGDPEVVKVAHPVITF